MRMRRSQQLGVAVVASAAMVLAACGGSDDEGGDASEAPASEAPASEAPASEAPSSEMGSEMASETGSEMGSEMGSEAAAGDVELPSPVVVGTKFDQPLFGVETPDGIVGFDADIAREIVTRLGGDPEAIEFREAVSDNREPFLQNGEVDMVVATYTINDERDEVVDFAGPYYVAGQDILVPSGNPEGIEGIDSLNTPDLTTCTAEGSTSLENLNEMAPDADIITFDVYSKCTDAMSQGRVDAVSTDNVILLGLADESGGEFELVENPFTDEPYGIGVAEGSELRCAINGALQEMYDDGSWAEIYENTAGAVASQTPEPPELDNEGC